MKSVSNDRRSRKTESSIEKAFLELMSKKDINKITVKDITELADTNRGTFYLHYIDILDLQDRIEDKVIEAMVSVASKNLMVGFKENRIMNITNVLEYIRENRQIFRAFLHSSRSMLFLEKMTSTIEQKLLLDIHLSMDDIDGEFTRKLTVFFINGSIALIKDWLTRDTDASPAELAAVIETILQMGLAGFSGQIAQQD